MKKGLLAVVSVLVLAGCGSNGWSANHVDGNEDCVQVDRWESNGWTTKTWAEGLYCKPQVIPTTPTPSRGDETTPGVGRGGEE